MATDEALMLVDESIRRYANRNYWDMLDGFISGIVQASIDPEMIVAVIRYSWAVRANIPNFDRHMGTAAARLVNMNMDAEALLPKDDTS